jgi:dihydroneopterin aldolase
MDTIFIREFRVDAWVGVYDWEKQRAQTLEMDIEIGLQPMAQRTENIHDTVNYGEIVERVQQGARRPQVPPARGARGAPLHDHPLRFRGDLGAALVAKIGHVRGVRKLGVTLERRREAARD